MTTETDEKTNQPTKPGAINGGFYKKTADMPLQHPSLVIAVDDIKEHQPNINVQRGGHA